ncbi:Phosphoenolpyruvate synthase [Actinomycetales bacterium JB111]|nr:Phosphoenolpyruvate synthase [Actinomycetales bacterium JB111]
MVLIGGVMLRRLTDATLESSGGKAAALGALLRAGLPVPDGFVIPHHPDDGAGYGLSPQLRNEVAGELARLEDPVVAVRSSALNEDTADASAAGQYESVVGVRGVEGVCEATVTCRTSADAPRANDYWGRTPADASSRPAGMPVLVQRVVAADVSGVMFTPQRPEEPTRIEASWGLGPSVVGGTVTPDTYEVAAGSSVSHRVGSKQTRIDLDTERGGVATTTVTPRQQQARTLDDDAVLALATLGMRIAAIQGGPQDVEWAVTEGTIWLLQTRPITAALPVMPQLAPTSTGTLRGTPASRGTVTGTARTVRGPSDFGLVEPGDILVCPYTDPAWTPLFRIAAGVVTATGGALSHAAIVAREYRIPAVVGVPDALNLVTPGRRVAIDGAAGTITPA